MPSWLKNIVSLGHRRKGSTTARKQDQSSSNSQSDPKPDSQLKASSSNGHKSQPESHPDKGVGESKKGQPKEDLPRNTKNSDQQPRDSDNMTAAAAVSPTKTPDNTSSQDHIHLNKRTGDLIQTSAHNDGVGDIENSANALNPNQIIFILKSDDTDTGHGGYRIYSLLEEEPSSAGADEDGDGEKAKAKLKVINGKTGDDGHDEKSAKAKSPFKLSVTCAQNLPEELKEEFLVAKIPDHLANVDELHVIVSTRSGLGLAAGFYEGVLKRLLGEGFGFVGVGDYVVKPEGKANDQEKEGRSRQDKREGGRKYRITVTKSADTVKDFARGLVSSSPPASSQGKQQQPSRTIILLSGDGGIIDLLNGLDHPDQHGVSSPQSSSPLPPPTPILAILPLGTGNALFHSLHKPLYIPEGPSPLVLGLRTLIKRGVSAPLPTFRAEFSPGAKLISSQPEVLPDDEEPKDNLLFEITDAKTDTTDTIGKQEEEKEKNAKPKPRPEISHLLGAIVFSYGFHASLVYESDTPAYRVHGDKRFGMAAGELLKISHLYDASLSIRRRCTSSSSSSSSSSAAAAAAAAAATASGTATTESNWKLLSRDSHSTYILTTLVSNLEKTFCISPHSKPLDGQLRLVHFGFGEDTSPSSSSSEERGKTTMDIMMAAYRDGEHVKDSEQKFKGVVGYEEVEEIKVTINETDERWRKVCVDGTIVEVERDGWVSVRREEGGGGKERLRVLVDEGVVVGRG